MHDSATPETDKKLLPGALYLIDFGAQYLDGTTDVTRTVAIGEPTEEMRRQYRLVLKGHRHCHGALPGGHARGGHRRLRKAGAVGGRP